MNYLLILFIAYLVFLLAAGLRAASRKKQITESHDAGVLNLTLNTVLGLPGILIITVFAALGYEYGISIAWSGFGFLVGIIVIYAIAILRLRGKLPDSFSGTPTIFKAIENSHSIKSRFGGFYLAVLGILAALQLKSVSSAFLDFLNNNYKIAESSHELVFLVVTALIFLALVMITGLPERSSTSNSVLRLNGILVLILSGIAFYVALFSEGGIDDLVETISRINPGRLELNSSSLLFVTGGFFMGLAVTGQPHILSKILAESNRTNLMKAGIASVCLSVVIVWSAIYFGLASGKFVTGSGVTSDSFDLVMSGSIENSLSGTYYFFTKLIFSVSFFLVSLRYLLDLKSEFDTSQSQEPGLIQLVGFIRTVGLIALVLLVPGWKISAFVLWTFAGCVIGPIVLASAMKKINLYSVVAGMWIGGLTTIIWGYCRINGFRLWELPVINEIIPGFLLGLLAIFIVEHLTRKLPEQDSTSK